MLIQLKQYYNETRTESIYDQLPCVPTVKCDILEPVDDAESLEEGDT